MKLKNSIFSAFSMAAVILSIVPLQAQETSTVRMTVTASARGNKPVPQINPDEVFVKQGKERLQVTEWVAAKGDRAGLDLFILIDDASDTSLGSNLDDLRAFIKAQPNTTAVAVGYMRNATVQITQDFTTDHAAAANALRLPLGSEGAYGSPYLSVIDLMKRWPANDNRRSIIMVTDGIDRARRGTDWHGIQINSDMDLARDVAMKTGTIINTIYTPGVGYFRRNHWTAVSGQMTMGELADLTGGQAFYLGLQSPVSFKPYLDQIQKAIDNQYLLSFSAKAGAKAKWQSVDLSTELSGVELAAADSVWVPAVK
jgi:hypothetical protein